MRGIALGGGGHRIARVDVSIDGGQSYVPAELDDHGMEKLHKRNYHWSWHLKGGESALKRQVLVVQEGLPERNAAATAAEGRHHRASGRIQGHDGTWQHAAQ